MKLKNFLTGDQINESDKINFIEDFMNKGRAKEKGITEKDVDPEELKQGIKVEYEHTSNAIIAKRIALDHLAEDGMDKYYTALAKMEDDLRKNSKG